MIIDSRENMLTMANYLEGHFIFFYNQKTTHVVLGSYQEIHYMTGSVLPLQYNYST